MDAGTLLVMVVGVVGLVAVVVLRTRGARTTMGARASLAGRQHGPNFTIDDDVREQALLLLDRGEKIAAIKLVHEQADLGLREARDFVAHLEHTTTFVRDDDDAPPARPAADDYAERPARSGWDERPAERAGWDDAPARSAHSGWDERPAASQGTPARPDWDDTPARAPQSSWDERPASSGGGGAWDDRPASSGGGWDSSPSNYDSGSSSSYDSGSSSSSDSSSSSSSDY